MCRRIVICLPLTLFLLTVSFADAQQPKKVPRYRISIGERSLYCNPPAPRHSGRLCASLATSRERTSPLTTDMLRESPIASLRLRPNSCVSRSISSCHGVVRHRSVRPRMRLRRFPL